MLNRDDIAAMIPHDGGMVLLDRVAAWSGRTIECITATHRDPHNPLRGEHGLSSLCGIEYGMQAMALHGTLVDAAKNRQGYLAGLRDVTLGVDRLDDIESDLHVTAELVLDDAATAIYRFALSADGRTLVSGQGSVFLRDA